jgi:septum formation protein
MANMRSSLWLASESLVLASQSRARLAILESAGIPVEVCGSALDERRIEAPALQAGASPENIALLLAKAKALKVSAERRGCFVLGADQVLVLEGKILHKAQNREELRTRLEALSGRRHSLCAAAALVRDGEAIFETFDVAVLVLRALTGEFIERYLDAVGESALSSTGGYEIEGIGIHLMEQVEGDYATILGMPLLSILDQLRRLGLLAA